MTVDAQAVKDYLVDLQQRITTSLQALDGGETFRADEWERAEGGGGRSMVLRDGDVFEQAGVNFSDSSVWVGSKYCLPTRASCTE